MANRGTLLRSFVAATILLFLLFGLVADGPQSALEGFLRLQTVPTRLLSDFTAMQGTGAAFLNAACVGLTGLFVVRQNKVVLSGPTIAALFAMMGFALFGKTLLTCFPIIAGVSLAGLIVGKKPREYVLIAMFGTALGPVISYVAFELGFSPIFALPAAMIIGVLAGILLVPLAITMLHLHQGYSLYNVGLTAGFLGLFAASLPSAGGMDLFIIEEWGRSFSPWLVVVIPILSLLALGLGLSGSREARREAWKEFRAILRLSGRLPSDFCDRAGERGALINAGILGLVYSAYVAIVKAPFNGPVVGGLMTIVGFGFFGKHLRNIGPVFAGLLAAALLFGKDLAEGWVILAFLFGTALAPLAGEFGFFAGMTAGFLHLVVVERTNSWHGGMNLYNNGFASGLAATLIVSVMGWYKSRIRIGIRN